MRFQRSISGFILVTISGLLACNQPATEKTASTTESAAGSGEFDRTHLPIASPPFGGVIGKTYKESKEEWPRLVSAPEGAPNVIIIMLDDVGFGQVSSFGGPVPTPYLDSLAAEGLRYTRFHTTAICGPQERRLSPGATTIMPAPVFWQNGLPAIPAITI